MNTVPVESEHDHFPIAAAVAKLAEIARKHDIGGLIKASDYADMAPTVLLRGISFLGECLETYDEPPPMQAKLAHRAIQEITALCAVMLEIECSASSYRLFDAQEGGKA